MAMLVTTEGNHFPWHGGIQHAHVDQGKDGSDQDRVFYDLDRPGKRHVLVILAVM